MTITSPEIFVVLGLILWLVPWPEKAKKLADVGQWTFIIAFAVWLGLGQ